MNKSDAANSFQISLANIRSNGVPSIVKCLCSDNGDEVPGGVFEQLCAENGIWKEFTKPNTPKSNCVLERGLGIADAACLQAPL